MKVFCLFYYLLIEVDYLSSRGVFSIKVRPSCEDRNPEISAPNLKDARLSGHDGKTP
jgi:hypothetical protein